MPGEWLGSDALHPLRPGGALYSLYMVGLPPSPPPSLLPLISLTPSLSPFFSLPPLTFPPSIEFADVLVVGLGRLCSNIRLLC